MMDESWVVWMGPSRGRVHGLVHGFQHQACMVVRWYTVQLTETNGPICRPIKENRKKKLN